LSCSRYSIIFCYETSGLLGAVYVCYGPPKSLDTDVLHQGICILTCFSPKPTQNVANQVTNYNEILKT
jgi:hypothetical protein